MSIWYAGEIDFLISDTCSCLLQIEHQHARKFEDSDLKLIIDCLFRKGEMNHMARESHGKGSAYNVAEGSLEHIELVTLSLLSR